MKIDPQFLPKNWKGYPSSQTFTGGILTSTTIIKPDINILLSICLPEEVVPGDCVPSAYGQTPSIKVLNTAPGPSKMWLMNLSLLKKKCPKSKKYFSKMILCLKIGPLRSQMQSLIIKLIFVGVVIPEPILT